ncbi:MULTISPECIES: diguanylate cyclase [unclassified Cyanobium]|uniref:GGDEF domain-containing protein n=1 Tax=unclassified Cyanobium TaxID=2627006 RepID=UPI0020CCF348|nr:MULTISPECIES: sensor domain-containing diguanylate cyclase [unclassified Cyanobium]
MPSRLADGSPGERPSITLPLQSAGLLCALIFLINSIFEVLVINHLYGSQYFLIALLLAVLSLWAFLEVALIGRRAVMPPLRILKLLLASQIVLILIRHGGDFSSRSAALSSAANPALSPQFGLAIVSLPIYLLLFLAISRCLIDAFSYAERRRAKQLLRQMTILKQTKAELQPSELRYRLIADNVDDVIWTLDSQGRFTFISPSVKTLLGYGAEQWIGKPLKSLLDPASAFSLESALKQWLKQRQPVDAVLPSHRAALEHVHQDGSLLWTEITMATLRQEDGQLMGFVVVTRDIHIRKLYERNLSEARDAAEETNSALISANALLHGRATTDGLTGLLNRRHFEDILRAQMKTSAEYNESLSLMVIDVDSFKDINDISGHTLGDRILVDVSNLIAASLRKSDRLARWGGDEFIMMMPRVQADEALQVANRLCESVACHTFPGGRVVTLSIGVAERRPHESLDQWFDRADAALYAVKKAGRNAARHSA